MKELDNIDRKILLELDLDSRQSISSLAKKLRISNEIANYRIKKLTSNGIIEDFYARPGISKLNIFMFRSILRFYNLSLQKEKEIHNYIINTDKVGWSVKIDGNWDLNFVYWAESIFDFEEFISKFLIKYGKHIKEKKFSILLKLINYPKLFLSENKITNFPVYELGGTPVSVSIEEKKILAILTKNSRTPTIEIANKTNLTPKTVVAKIKRMKKNGIIQGFGIGINLEKTGYEYYKTFINTKNISKERITQIMEYCRKHPSIVYSNTPFELIGGADLEIEFIVKNKQEYLNYIKELRYKFSDIIKDFETLHYTKRLKNNLFPISF